MSSRALLQFPGCAGARAGTRRFKNCARNRASAIVRCEGRTNLCLCSLTVLLLSIDNESVTEDCQRIGTDILKASTLCVCRCRARYGPFVLKCDATGAKSCSSLSYVLYKRSDQKYGCRRSSAQPRPAGFPGCVGTEPGTTMHTKCMTLLNRAIQRCARCKLQRGIIKNGRFHDCL